MNQNNYSRYVFENSIPNTSSKLLSFEKLEDGWLYGRGTRSDRTALLGALDLYALLGVAGFKETDAFPGEDGEIVLTAYKDDCYLEFLFDKNHLSVRREDGETETANFENVTQARALQCAISRNESSLDLRTRSITTQEKKGLSVSHLKNHPPIMPPLSSTWNVSNAWTAVSVPTYLSSTQQMSLENRPSSLYSQKVISDDLNHRR